MSRSYFFIVLLVTLFSCKDKNKLIETDVEDETTINTVENRIAVIDSVFLSKTNDSMLISFYKKNALKTFWSNHSCRENLVQLFQSVEFDGLHSKDFDLKKINKNEKSFQKLNDNELVDYDFLLTKNLIQYIKKVAIGSLDPQSLYKDWDLKKNKIDIQEHLLDFQKKDSFDYALFRIKPKHKVYQSLEEALKLLETFPKDDLSKIEISDKIVANDTNNVLIPIKKRLMYWNDLKPIDSLTSIYDESTQNAIKKFQMRHGLAPDGIIGKGTVAALNFSKEKRKAQIIVNMERWRWYPKEFERDYLIINIPDYTLLAIKDKDTSRTHKVIVGTAKRSTPILSSKLSYVVFNPTWTVPPTILKEDVIPATQKNRSYLAKKNITVYDSKGQIVSAENWQASQARSYRYVQSPGSSNSLGLVKIMFPNRFSVYLHDTNTRGYFERENRSISSGCVRVQNPFELTEYLLNDPEKWNKERIDEIIKEGATKNVNINHNCYIHLLYWTAWSENGQLIFRDDIYNLDAELYKKLRN
ncbi:L,D-transpeptidase family protein [Flavobacterium sp. UBA6135]|uniref:L,D-transpeptidase family protein n=1 Tax=Flavobacterium sp. UBA6135 TaxID=1946553 RepID=UPI0025BCC19D|nr:L,D-transpeptidase family protein [Flavobacterium sp. UBA6135]